MAEGGGEKAVVASVKYKRDKILLLALITSTFLSPLLIACSLLMPVNCLPTTANDGHHSSSPLPGSELIVCVCLYLYLYLYLCMCVCMYLSLCMCMCVEWIRFVGVCLWCDSKFVLSNLSDELLIIISVIRHY